MMEGYFVRTLGMHRVYNSAFMNMLKREQNADYREIIRKTLAFEPGILGRFVNFMNNPDEETAVTQFGTGDKYFAAATLLSTMPGLPMFGHGQIEGLAEKYGMEFRRPYWDEQPDADLISRHEREIFPLLRKREAFASATNFRFFDVHRDDGSVAESVYAYTNRDANGVRTLVVVNNAYESVQGTMAEAVPVASGTATLVDHVGATVADGEIRDDSFLVYQNARTGLWHLRRATGVRDGGWRVMLGGYQSEVYWGFELRQDTDGKLAKLEAELGGAGVPDIERAASAHPLDAVRTRVSELVASEDLRLLDDAILGTRELDPALVDGLRVRCRYALAELESAMTKLEADRSEEGVEIPHAVRAFERRLTALATIPHAARTRGESASLKAARGAYFGGIRRSPERRALLVGWLELAPLADLAGGAVLSGWGAETWPAGSFDRRLLRLLLEHRSWWVSAASGAELVSQLLSNESVREYIGVNTYKATEYYHVESFSELVWALFAIAFVELTASTPRGGETAREAIASVHETLRTIELATREAHGRVDLLEAAMAETKGS
jgi:hypothetical protein